MYKHQSVFYRTQKKRESDSLCIFPFFHLFSSFFIHKGMEEKIEYKKKRIYNNYSIMNYCSVVRFHLKG